MESFPLWVWAVIVGIIISTKFVYRWMSTKDLANVAEQSRHTIKGIRRNWTTKNPTGVIDHKYDPQKYSPSRFKDYFTTKKNNNQKLE
jgi:hypothetical protein